MEKNPLEEMANKYRHLRLLERKYTADDLNYGDDSTRATAEQHNKDARPEIANDIDFCIPKNDLSLHPILIDLV